MTIFHRLRRSAPSCRGAAPIVRQGHLALGGIIMPGERLALEEDFRQIPIDRFPYVPIDLVNNAAADLVAGDVVAVSATDSNSVVGMDTMFTRGVYVVAQDLSIPRGLPGRFALSGETLVKASGTIALGEYVQKSSAARAVEGCGQTRTLGSPQLPPPYLALGHAVEASSGGFVRCFLYGTPDQSTLTAANGYEFVEDFESTAAAFVALGAAEQWKYAWFRGSAADSNTAYGVMRLTGDGGNAPFFRLQGPGAVFATPFTPGGGIVVEARFAQVGVAAGTRRLGISALAITTVDPVNGIFFRFTVGGNVFAVLRKAGVESTVDTGFVASNGIFATFRIVVDISATVYVLANGVRVGSTDTSNLPIGPLGWSGGNSAITAANGFDLDTVRVLVPRVPTA